MAAKRDVSGVFEAELKLSPARKAAVLDSVSHLSHKGISFVSETCLPAWTEVGVELQMPATAVAQDHSVNCRGVVVDCARQQNGKGYKVAMIFLDLPEHLQVRLAVPATPLNPSRISITR